MPPAPNGLDFQVESKTVDKQAGTLDTVIGVYFDGARLATISLRLDVSGDSKAVPGLGYSLEVHPG